MPTYQTRAKKYLAAYKRHHLGVMEDGIWSKNGSHYPHLLPRALGRLNILETYRDEFFDWFDSVHIKLHRDFHHLTSSQALCFNLIFPFTASSESQGTLCRLLGFPEAGFSKWGFEHVENEREGTNFDFWAVLTNDQRLFFELKFTEAGFGSCANDEHHRHK